MRWWVLSDAELLIGGCLGDLGCGSWTMMPSAPLQHYHHEKYCIRIIIFGWMYNWFLWKNLCTNFGIFWVSIFCSWDWIFWVCCSCVALVCSWSRWIWNRNLIIWMWNLGVYGFAGDWLVCWIYFLFSWHWWRLDLVAGFVSWIVTLLGKNNKK